MNSPPIWIGAPSGVPMPMVKILTPICAARSATAMTSSSWFSPSVMRMMTRPWLSSVSPENDSRACSSALPMAVPCTDTSEGSIRRAKARAMR